MSVAKKLAGVESWDAAHIDERAIFIRAMQVVSKNTKRTRAYSKNDLVHAWLWFDCGYMSHACHGKVDFIMGVLTGAKAKI